MDLVSALNKAMGSDLTENDHAAWYDGETEGNMVKFDAVVKQYLGDELYDAADVCARLDLVLYVKLGGSIKLGNEHSLCEAIIAHPERYKNGF